MGTVDKGRRDLLAKYLGDQVKLRREFCKPKDPLRGRYGQLVAVKRTRAEIDYDDLGRWVVPVNQVLMPGTVEPMVNQLALF